MQVCDFSFSPGFDYLCQWMQGGIGKTVISSWLVRHDRIRAAFEKIVWVSLGQTPNLNALQGVLYEQLVPGDVWDPDKDDVFKVQSMGAAFRGQNVLLVLDDLCTCF
eukprot:COSAG01_NODE_946_length_12533_cov_4.570532_2_plen_107_part_00